MEVDELEWDEANIEHCARHELTPTVAESVRTGAPKLFPNGESKTGSHVMVGPNEPGRYWTVILLDLGNGKYRPITGWPSTNTEIRHYRSES